MRFLYEWINCDSRRIFNNCGINFTSDYRISYDLKSSTLYIEKVQTAIRPSFYSLKRRGIVDQITCFVGKNGCGKTSILNHIYLTDMIQMESYIQENYPYWNTIQVFEFDGRIKIYHNQSNLAVKGIENFEIFSYQKNPSRHSVDEVLNDGDYANTTKIFLSNNQYAYLNQNFTNQGRQEKFAITPYDIGVLQSNYLEGLIRLDNDVLVLKNKFYYFNQSLKRNINKGYFQNLLYLYFLRDLNKNRLTNKFSYLKNLKVTFPLIKESDSFIESFGLHQLVVNHFGAKKIIYNQISHEDIQKYALQISVNVDMELLQFCAIHGFVLQESQFKNKSMYSNLITNLTTEIMISLIEFKIDVCDLSSYDIEYLLQVLDREITQGEMLLKVDNEKLVREKKYREYNYLCAAQKSIKNFKQVFESLEKEEIIITEKDVNFLDFIIAEIQTGQSYILKYLSVSYGCSAGERAFLNLFSWLNFIPHFHNFSNTSIKGINKNVLLMVDEPDLYCHPEWQRKMIREMIETFELLYKDKSVHLIISTHSPLLLSDMPNENVIKILVDAENKRTFIPMEERSFGANIFDLYNDSFYLDSFIGEFAQQKIKEIILLLSQNRKEKSNEISENELKNAEDIVDLIGEPILRTKLKDMINKARERKRNDWNTTE